MSDEYRTKSGRVLTDEDFERLADEAEIGYDIDRIVDREGARMETQTQDEAKELFDRATEAQSSSFDGIGTTEVESKDELIALAKQALKAGTLLTMHPQLLLVALGAEEEPEEPEGEPTKEDPEGDDRIREPEKPGQGPTSQPGPAQEPGGPSQTPEHPAPQAPSPGHRWAVDVPREVREALTGYLASLNSSDPPTYDPPWFMGRYRHTCPERRERSTALDLKERYVTIQDAIDESNERLAKASGGLAGPATFGGPGFEPEDRDLFAIVFREGKCKWCGQTARSSEGRVVAVSERPPMFGRVAR